MSSTLASAPRSVSPNVLVAVLAFAGIVASLMQTLVVPLIRQLPDLLGTTAANASWVVTVTLLTGAVSMPVAGRLGDVYGKRPVLLALLVPLVGGSVVCALATSLAPMVVGRGLQGLATSMVPLGISLLHEVLPAARVGSAIALMSSSMGIGGALGLPVSAAVAQYASWRVLFWGTAVLGVLIAVAVRAVVPGVPARPAGARRDGFDGVGAVLLSAAVVALLLAVSKGADWGWGSATVLGLLVGAVAVLLFWGRWELRRDGALVDLRIAARPRVLVTNLASVVVGFALYAQSLIVPQILQLPAETGYGLGQSMIQMGLWMAPAGFAMMAVSSLGARITAARGPKTTLVTGALAMACGYALATALMGHAWGLMIATCLGSAGLGLAYGSMPAIVMGGVPKSQTASANSVNSLMRSFGTTIAAAVVGVVLAHQVVPFGDTVVTSEAGFRTGLVIGCGVAVAAALLALAIPAAPADAGESADAGPAGAALAGDRAAAVAVD